MNAVVPEPTAAKMAVRTAIILVLFVVVFTGLLSSVYFWTLPTIKAAASEEKMKLIDEVLPRSHYDNALLEDTVEIAPTQALGLDVSLTRHGPVGSLAEAAAARSSRARSAARRALASCVSVMGALPTR